MDDLQIYTAVKDAVYCHTDIDLYYMEGLFVELGIDELPEEFERELINKIRELSSEYIDQITDDAFKIFKEMLKKIVPEVKISHYPEDNPWQLHLFE